MSRPSLADVMGSADVDPVPLQVGTQPSQAELDALAHVPGNMDPSLAPPAALGQAPPVSLGSVVGQYGRGLYNANAAVLGPFTPSNIAATAKSAYNEADQRFNLAGRTSTHRGWGEDRSAPPLVFPGSDASNAPPPQAFSPWNPGSGLTNVKAQNVDLTAPEYQAQMQAELARHQGDYLGKEGQQVNLGEAKAGAALEQAAGVGAEREEVRGLTEAQKRENHEADEFIRKLQGKRAGRIEELLHDKLEDPDAKRNVVGRIADLIGSGAGGFLQGWNRLSSNPYFDEQRQFRQENMERQRGNLAARRASINDYTQELQDALAVRQGQRADQQHAANLGLRAAELVPQQAALASQAPVERAGANAAAADTALQASEAGIGGVKETMAEHHYVPAHAVQTGPDRAKITRDAEELYKLGAVNNPNFTMDDAIRASIKFNTGHDIFPGSPGASIAKPPKDAAAGTPSLDAIAPQVAGSSTNWDPRRFVQGSEAFQHAQVQDRWNSQIKAAVHKAYGARSPEAMESVGKAYLIDRGDTPETIARKVAAARADLGKAMATAPAADGTPQGFAEAGSELER